MIPLIVSCSGTVSLSVTRLQEETCFELIILTISYYIRPILAKSKSLVNVTAPFFHPLFHPLQALSHPTSSPRPLWTLLQLLQSLLQFPPLSDGPSTSPGCAARHTPGHPPSWRPSRCHVGDVKDEIAEPCLDVPWFPEELGEVQVSVGIFVWLSCWFEV